MTTEFETDRVKSLISSSRKYEPLYSDICPSEEQKAAEPPEMWRSRRLLRKRRMDPMHLEDKVHQKRGKCLGFLIERLDIQELEEEIQRKKHLYGDVFNDSAGVNFSSAEEA